MSELSDLIEEFKSNFERYEILRRDYLYSISKEQLFKDFRNFGSVKIDGKYQYFSHFKNNRWFNRNQEKIDGSVSQLRDEFIQKLKESTLLNEPTSMTFDELFKEIGILYQAIKALGIKGADQMTIYDISCFFGSHIMVYPDRVYVHQGVKKGARALGLIEKNKATVLNLNAITKCYPEFEILSDMPALIECFLCIRKDELAQISFSQ